eukprot:2533084-Prymnesium_polylepis.1
MSRAASAAHNTTSHLPRWRKLTWSAVRSRRAPRGTTTLAQEAEARSGSGAAAARTRAEAAPSPHATRGSARRAARGGPPRRCVRARGEAAAARPVPSLGHAAVRRCQRGPPSHPSSA